MAKSSGKRIVITIDNIDSIDCPDIIATFAQGLASGCPDAEYSISYEDVNTTSSTKTKTENKTKEHK